MKCGVKLCEIWCKIHVAALIVLEDTTTKDNKFTNNILLQLKNNEHCSIYQYCAVDIRQHECLNFLAEFHFTILSDTLGAVFLGF